MFVKEGYTQTSVLKNLCYMQIVKSGECSQEDFQFPLNNIHSTFEVSEVIN